MAKPTTQDIAAEIAALEALVPAGRFKEKTAASIELEIACLRGEVDETTEEFRDMDEEQSDVYNSCRAWKDGQSKNRPSVGWIGLVE